MVHLSMSQFSAQTKGKIQLPQVTTLLVVELSESVVVAVVSVSVAVVNVVIGSVIVEISVIFAVVVAGTLVLLPSVEPEIVFHPSGGGGQVLRSCISSLSQSMK